MGDGGAHVVADEALIERIVLTRRVFEYTRVERCAFVPQPRHAFALLPLCSSGGIALTSATISVPVPSFVNTSPRMPSGDEYETTCTRRTPPRIASSIAFALGSMPSTMRFSSLR